MTAEPIINSPELWEHSFPRLKDEGHKYDRGHAVIFGGGLTGTGAARLAARSALRIGAGLVTLAVPGASIMAHVGRSPDALMTKRADDGKDMSDIVKDDRVTAVCIGPAYGIIDGGMYGHIETLAEGKCGLVLDADIFTNFAGKAHDLKAALGNARDYTVLTPHEGEFNRLFGDKYDGLSRTQKAAKAAKYLRTTLVLKGAETIIANGNGSSCVNTNAPPQLATAGSGDVLSGIITGLLAQGMPAFEAACAGVWLHGEAGNIAGIGLIADDLPEVLRIPLKKLQQPPQAKIGFGD